MASKKDMKTSAGRIKLIAPMSRYEDARALGRLGADELYFSYQPAGARAAMSRRELAAANFTDFEDVEIALEIAKKSGRAVFAALNKTYYTNDELKAAKKILDVCMELGAAGVIAADPGFLRTLHRLKYDGRIEIILSAVAAPVNSEAIRFFSEFGISRVILPRHVKPEWAGRYARAFPSIAFEVFIFNWHCMNLDGVCRFQHEVTGNRGGLSLIRNGCCLCYDMTGPDGKSAAPDVFADVHRRSESACAVCSMYDFAEAGVRHFKIVGRLLPPEGKAESVKFVSGCRDILEASGGRAEFISRAREYYKEYFGKPCGGTCYHGVRNGVK